MSTNVNIAKTPIGPYLGVVNSMNRIEKMALVLYLADSLPGVEIVESNRAGEISQEDEEFLEKKLKEMSFSPRVRRLMKERREAAEAIDLGDERTRYMLGL